MTCVLASANGPKRNNGRADRTPLPLFPSTPFSSLPSSSSSPSSSFFVLWLCVLFLFCRLFLLLHHTRFSCLCFSTKKKDKRRVSLCRLIIQTHTTTNTRNAPPHNLQPFYPITSIVDRLISPTTSSSFSLSSSFLITLSPFSCPFLFVSSSFHPFSTQKGGCGSSLLLSSHSLAFFPHTLFFFLLFCPLGRHPPLFVRVISFHRADV